jgi:hypothetical protein
VTVASARRHVPTFSPPIIGAGGTFPTFLVGAYVVKFFPRRFDGGECFLIERSLHTGVRFWRFSAGQVTRWRALSSGSFAMRQARSCVRVTRWPCVRRGLAASRVGNKPGPRRRRLDGSTSPGETPSGRHTWPTRENPRRSCARIRFVESYGIARINSPTHRLSGARHGSALGQARIGLR